MITAPLLQETFRDDTREATEIRHASEEDARTLFMAATRLYEEGSRRKARGLYQQCLLLAREREDWAAAGWCLLPLADIARQAGSDTTETPMARLNTLAEEALPLFRAAGDTRGEAASLLLLSIAFLMRRDMDEVERRIAQSQALSEASGDLSGVAAALERRAAGLPREDHDRRDALYARALKLYREAGDKRGQAKILTHQSRHLWFRRKPTQAVACCQEALALYRAVGDKENTAASLLTYARSLPEAEQEACYHEAVRLSHEVEVIWCEAAALDSLGLLAQRRREWNTAHAYFTQALNARMTTRCNEWCAHSLRMFAGLAQEEGRAAAATRLYAAISALERESAYPLPILPDILDRLRAILGQDRFRALWEEGVQFSVEDAIDLALRVGEEK